MPSITVPISESPIPVIEFGENVIGKINFIEILNNTASDIVITIIDSYTTIQTDNGINSQTRETPRKVIKVAAGDDVSWENQECTIDIFGTCVINSSATSSDIYVTIGFKEE